MSPNMKEIQTRTLSPDELRAAARAKMPAAMVIGMVSAVWAELCPDRMAVSSEQGDRTFGELNAHSNQLVRALRARGLKAGDSIAVLCGNRPEMVEILAAARRAGLRLTPINWHLTGDEAGYVVADCDAKAFFAEARFAPTAERIVELAPTAGVRIAIG